MSRAARLLELMQNLRARRVPVPGPVLADELGISIRTLYRDIATLQAQGAQIEGEPGLGYILRPGFTLPPLMFSADEIEALVLGSRWVSRRSEDERLSAAAGSALAKITAVLPPGLRDLADDSPLLVAGSDMLPAAVDFAEIRRAIGKELKLEIDYASREGEATRRTIWPFGIGFFEEKRVVMAWCELRGDYRHFRIDRIAGMAVRETRYPCRRAALLRDWKRREGIAER